MTSYPNVAAAEQYVEDVLSGKIPACKWVKLACKRQVKDLKRAKKGWQYRFDPDAAQEVCTLIEQLPHIKGDKAKAGERIKLEPWQSFITAVAFGWKRVSDGGRRFRRVYIEVPRGNGKSTWSSGIGVFGLSLDGERGAEVYSAATTRDQARIVFRDAQNMLRKAPKVRDLLGIQVNAHGIVVPSTASKFEALSADSGTLDGLNTHLAIIDELHAHKTRDVYDVIETSIGKRSQSMLWTITTAGSDQTGICYEIRTLLTKVLESSGGYEDEQMFGIIYTIDEGDPWNDEVSWRKANPNWGVSVRPEVISQLAAKAAQTPAAQNNFKTKHLDVWVTADAALYSVDLWRKCAKPGLTREDVRDWSCIMGLDLANKNDIASRCDLFWRFRDEGEIEVAAFWQHYSNREAVASSRNASYSGWEIEGHLEVHDGNSTSQAQIEADALEFAREYGCTTLAMDKYEGDYIAERLMSEGIEVIVVPMNVQNLSKPTKLLDDLMREGRIRHGGDPVTEWMVSNVIGHLDKNDNVFPHKQRPENKIDGAIALIIALSVLLRQVGGEMYDRALSEHFEQEGLMIL